MGIAITHLCNTNWKLYACGEFTSYNVTACDEVIRINCAGANVGAKDPDFNMRGGGPNGANNGPVWCMKKQEGDNKIIIGGKFTTYATIPALNVTRILPSSTGPTSEAKNNIQYYDSEPEIDLFASTDVVLYPNPTSGMLYYKANGFGTEYTITVYDIMGRSVKQKTVDEDNKKNILDFSELPSGTYLVRFNNATQHITKTIIKK